MVRKHATENGKIWNTKELKAGDTLEGLYKSKEIVKGQFGEQEKYNIEADGGEVFSVFASASLARQFANIPEGSYVWLTYDGEVTSKNGRTVKAYSVDYDDDFKA